MPESCSIPGCTSRRGKGEACSLHFYHLPSNPDVRQCWLVSIKKSIVVSDYTRICSLHFIGGEKTVDNPIPTEFPWKTAKQPRKEPFARQPPSKKVKHNDEVRMIVTKEKKNKGARGRDCNHEEGEGGKVWCEAVSG